MVPPILKSRSKKEFTFDRKRSVGSGNTISVVDGLFAYPRFSFPLTGPKLMLKPSHLLLSRRGIALGFSVGIEKLTMP
jgi:hypothetical protein